MSVLSEIAIAARLVAVGRMIVCAAALAFGLGVLALVADRSKPTEAEVVVHVCEPDVEVRVGDRVYAINGCLEAPLVCNLPPGTHPLSMRRGDRTLFEQQIDLEPGAEVVCTLWDEAQARSLAPGPSRGRRAVPRGSRSIRPTRAQASEL